MQESFKMKARRMWTKTKSFGRKALPWVPVIATALTVTAAWEGRQTSRRNSKRLDDIENWGQETTGVINHNADVLERVKERVNDLEAKNKELLDEAIAVTEGKEAPAE